MHLSKMWCALFLGLIVVALAEDAPKAAVSPSSSPAKEPEKNNDAGVGVASTAEVTKRDSDKGNVLIHGSPPHNYVLQPADSQQQPAYQQNTVQPELYIGSYRKPQNAPVSYSHQPQRQRVQYITLQQLAALQAQAAQLQAEEQKQHQQLQPDPNYEALLRQYQKPIPTQPPQQVQFASSAIVGQSSGTFEEELAQLVAANRAQEQKYHEANQDAAHHQTVPANHQPIQPTVTPTKKPAPQQYLKEVTRPVARPVVRPTARQHVLRPIPRPVIYQQQHQQAQPVPVQVPVQYEPVVQIPQAVQPEKQAAPLYRFVYQQEPQPQKAVAATPVAQPLPESVQKTQYISAQEYYRQHAPIPIRPTPQEDTIIRQLLSNPAGRQYLPKAQQQAQPTQSTAAPARALYITQPATYRRPIAATRAPYQPRPLAGQHVVPQAADAVYQQSALQQTEEEPKQAAVAPHPQSLVRFPTSKDKPLTQEEFQQLLQLGGYTATLLASDPNAPHQEYLLQPRYVPYQQNAAGQSAQAQESQLQEAQPQQHQDVQQIRYVPQQLKRRPIPQYQTIQA